MKQSLLLLALCSGLAFAAPEGAPVTAGPLTSLDKLDSIKKIKDAPIPNRQVAIQSWLTANGSKVMFVSTRDLPMVDIRVVFDAGSARDGDKSGLASLVSRMIDEGTTDRDTTAIAKAFEDLGASFETSSYRDMSIADLRVLSRPDFLNPALDVYTDVLAHPVFPDVAFSRIFDGAQVGQQQKQQSPAAQAGILFYKNLYAWHPYAQPPSGNPETLKTIKAQDLRDFHRKYFVARNAVIALVGDIDEPGARAIAERISSALPAGEPAPALPDAPELTRSRHLHLNFPSQQTHILIGYPGITRNDPDYEALIVGNEILGGGGFTSLLMSELREKRGMTYGVYSGFVPMRAQGPFTINLSARADQTTQALDLVRKILKDFIRTGPTDAQVAEAKDNMLGSFPQSTASNSDILAYLASMGFYNQPLDYLDTYPKRIQAVTAEQIRDAFKRHLNPDKMLYITVG